MIQENKQELYTSPEVEVMEVKAQQVICGSYDGNPANMGWGDEQGNDNWN